MRFYNLLIFLLRAFSLFIAAAALAYFTLAYGWGFMIQTLVIAALITLILICLRIRGKHEDN